MSNSASPTRTVALQIAKKLGETEFGPVYRLQRIVREIGEAAAWEFVEQAAQVEAAGGMLLEKEQRRRTFGGVFFVLVRDAVTPAQREAIWPNKKNKRAKKQDREGDQPEAIRGEPSLPAAPWAERRPLLAELRTHPGTATTCKVTMIGRPGSSLVEKPAFTLMLLDSASPPTLPKGMPAPPNKIGEVTAYVSTKTWATIKPQLTNASDAALLNGPLVYDADLEGLVVLGQDGTTLGLDAAKRGQPLKMPTTARVDGVASALKAVVVGRPGKVIPFGGAVLTLMQVSAVPSLPKGIPAAPKTPTLVLVVISAKQWRQVETLLSNPDDALVVEGFPVLDTALPGVAVFATKATTKLANSFQG